MKTSQRYLAASLAALSVAFFAGSLLQAKQKDPRTVMEKECDNAYARCLTNCPKNDAQCIKACDRGWNNCNGYSASHKPPVHLPSGPIQTVPNITPGVEKSGPKASPSASPQNTAKPKTTKTPTR